MKNISTNGKIFLISLEGIALSKYYDSVKVETVGVGSTISDIPTIHEWPWTKSITIEEALRLMDGGLRKYVDAVNKALKVEVSQEEFDALVSITYNIGTGGMAKSTFMRLINAKNSKDAVGKAMMQWTKAGGKTLQGLVNRRTKEVNLYTKGNYGSTKGLVFPVDSVKHTPIYSKGKEIDLRDYV